jgi:hypothetical protein
VILWKPASSEAKAWLDELREQIAAYVGDAEKQLSNIDMSEPATKQALAALVAAQAAVRSWAVLLRCLPARPDRSRHLG